MNAPSRYPGARVSSTGRRTVARAVATDHDWDLRFSSVDIMIAALEGLSDEDLKGVALLAQHFSEAIGCLQLQRDAARRREST